MSGYATLHGYPIDDEMTYYIISDGNDDVCYGVCEECSCLDKCDDGQAYMEMVNKK